MFEKILGKVTAPKKVKARKSSATTKRNREPIFIFKGKQKFTLAQLADKAKVPYMTMYMRYYQGGCRTYDDLMKKRTMGRPAVSTN